MPKILKAHGELLLILPVLCILSGIVMLGYGNQLAPLLVSETITATETSCTPETTVIPTTSIYLATGQNIHFLTSTTTIVSTYRVGPCPYGGTYFARIYTRLCGWQYDVCVTFDNNCANDYPAVYLTRTAFQTVIATTVSTEFLVQTRRDVVSLTAMCTTCKEVVVEKTVFREVSNPNIPNLRTLATVLIVAGIFGLLGGFWASSRSSRKKKITFRTIH